MTGMPLGKYIAHQVTCDVTSDQVTLLPVRWRHYLWAPAQRKRATMLYFANVFFYGRLILRPWLTEVRENFTRGGS